MSIVDEDRSVLGNWHETISSPFLTSKTYMTIHWKSIGSSRTRRDYSHLFLPFGFFEEARSGSATEPIEIWLNPRTPDEAVKNR